MNIRGERFHIPLGDADAEEDEYDAFEQSASKATAQSDSIAPSFTGFVKDVQERPQAAQKSPIVPTLKDAPHGFPTHKKRHGLSKFKQSRTDQSGTTAGRPATGAQSANNGAGFEQREKDAIDKENNARLASMSDEAIAKERAELLNGLSPSLVERLLRRANINTDTGSEGFPQPAQAPSTRIIKPSQTNFSQVSDLEPRQPRTKSVTFATSSSDTAMDPSVEFSEDTTNVSQDDKARDSVVDSSYEPTPTAATSIHFPRPPAAPELDPSSPSFLTDLHSKYFPSLPSDPSKLAWMTDPSTLPSYESSYSPEAESIPVPALRFSFRGILIPPRSALAIPVTQGLHHHGDAPESAGYTVPELAHLARSAFPAQRCVAFQTLGRIMYRLGRGEFGGEESELATGLWKCIKQGRVLDTLNEAAGRAGSHLSSQAYATDALWLWQQGGGHKVKAV